MIVVAEPRRDERLRLKRPAAVAGITTPATAPLLAGIFVLLLVYGLAFARPVLIPVVVAFFLFLVLRPLTRMLERVRVPRILGAALVLAGLSGLVGLASFQLLGPAQQWISTAPHRLAVIERKAQTLLQPVDRMREIADEIGKMAANDDPKADAVRIIDDSFSNLLMDGTQKALGYLVVVAVLLFFLLSSGDAFWRGLSQLCSSKIESAAFTHVVRDIETKFSAYLLTVSVINAGLGALVGIGMYLIGMPNPMLWGALAALFNFVPYLGALTGEILVTMVALFSFEDPEHALLAPLIYVVIAFTEGSIVTPLILGRRFSVNPVVIVVAMIFWGWVWGIIGLFLAVPIVVMACICADNVPSLAPVGKALRS